MDPVNTEGRALTVAAPSMPPASEPPPNPLLQTFRGHRTRTWGEVEARKCLQYLSYGMSQEAACIKSGIPVDAMYTDAPNARLLREAITEVYAHEGAAVWEDELYRIGLGDGEYQRTSAIVAGLKLHGRLRDKEAAGSVTINADQIVLQYQALSPEDREALRELARQRLKPTVIDAAAVPLASPPS